MTSPIDAAIEKADRIQIVSLGAGVQSTTMVLMAAHGLITPMPMCAIFADTQSEPAAVYDHLERLTKLLPFPVYVVTDGSLEHDIGPRPTGKYIRVSVPAYVKAPDGSVALMDRSCTRDYKITPLRRKVRELLGIAGKRSPLEPVVAQWIGISTDEASRMKPSREPWQEMRYPLIEQRMSRQDCLKWLASNGYAEPEKSACVFCPFHNDTAWRALKRNQIEWQRAVAVDRQLRARPAHEYRAKGTLFLHRSCKPLDEVDFSSLEDLGQLNMFENECEGMCGV